MRRHNLATKPEEENKPAPEVNNSFAMDASRIQLQARSSTAGPTDAAGCYGWRRTRTDAQRCIIGVELLFFDLLPGT